MCEHVGSLVGGEVVRAWTMQRVFPITRVYHTALTLEGKFTLFSTAEIMPHSAAAL
jgi:hypothetical protein